mgnify:CR=1 FL=1|jgi:hypothetical protein
MYNAHWSCHVSNDKVQVKYTTSLIKKPRKQFTLDVVTPNMEVVNRNWLVEEPAAVNSKTTNGWETYYIIDKKLKAAVCQLAGLAGGTPSAHN